MSAGGRPGGPSSTGPIDAYLLGDLLGVGGTASVYRATHRDTGQQVAVKILLPELSDSGGLRAYRSEVTTLAGLRHPGLVEIYGIGTDNGRTYLIMSLVDGEPLSERIERGPMPVREVTAIGASLADTLAHVHDHGVVHRDIKPSNVLLDQRQQVYLTDFGSSKLIDATRITATGLAVGTPAFMAPEQVRGQNVGPAADVYPLGLLLLEALTGRREYAGGMVESALARLHRDPVVPASLPAELRSLLTSMTSQEPGERPSSRCIASRLAALDDAGASPFATAALRTPNREAAPAMNGRLRPVLVAAASVVIVLAATLGGSTNAQVMTDPPAAAPPPTSTPPAPAAAGEPTATVPAASSALAQRPVTAPAGPTGSADRVAPEAQATGSTSDSVALPDPGTTVAAPEVRDETESDPAEASVGNPAAPSAGKPAKNDKPEKKAGKHPD